MFRKMFSRGALLLVLLLTLVAAVSADDNGLTVSGILQEATGLDESGMMQALMEGASLAQLIEANSGDVEATAAALAVEAAAQINQAKEVAIARLSLMIEQQLDRSWRWGLRGHAPFFGTTYHKSLGGEKPETPDATDTEETSATGVNLLTLIAANGGDVDGLVADLVAHATEQINASAAAQIEVAGGDHQRAAQRDLPGSLAPSARALGLAADYAQPAYAPFPLVLHD